MNKVNWPVTVVAAVWAVIILATAVLLKGTSYWAALLPILGGCAGAGSILPRKPGAKGRGISVLCVAIVWASAVAGTTVVLWATPYLLPVFLVLAWGTAASLLILAVARRGEAQS